MNKQVIRMGALALLTAIVMTSGFAVALRGHASSQQNRNTDVQTRNGNMNANMSGKMDANLNSNTGDSSANNSNNSNTPRD